MENRLDLNSGTEPLRWSTQAPPQEGKDFPCFLCKNKLAVVSRTVIDDPCKWRLPVCVECAGLPDFEILNII